MMSAYKFRIGKNVIYRPAVLGQDAPHGTYQMTRFLPQREDGEFEYRIKNLNEGHELVAKESELRGQRKPTIALNTIGALFACPTNLSEPQKPQESHEILPDVLVFMVRLAMVIACAMITWSLRWSGWS